MSISGIGSNGGYPMSLLTSSTPVNKVAAAPTGLPQTDDSSGGSALDYLTKYLNETPAQRMIDAWLKRHHLTEKQLESMPPDQQKAIRKQMADDIKKEIQQKSGVPGSNANITV